MAKAVKGITGATILWLVAGAGAVVYALTRKKPSEPREPIIIEWES